MSNATEKNIKIDGGYILLSRRIIESEIWNKPPLYIKVWIYLLSRAQHKPFRKLERGETWVSIPEIQEACSWYVGFRKETPTKKEVFGILEWLRSPQEKVANPCNSRFPYEGNDEGNRKVTTNAPMIVTTKATHGMLVKVVNYNIYQDPKNYKSNDEGNDEGNDEKPTKELRREREGNNINKNDKNDKNDNSIYNPAKQDNIPYKSIVDHLNLKAGKGYKPSTRKTKDLIKARWNEGFRESDFKAVIDIKSKEWLGSKEMEKFLRPETLFGPKFEGYLNQAPAPTKSKQSSEPTEQDLRNLGRKSL